MYDYSRLHFVPKIVTSSAKSVRFTFSYGSFAFNWVLRSPCMVNVPFVCQCNCDTTNPIEFNELNLVSTYQVPYLTILSPCLFTTCCSNLFTDSTQLLNFACVRMVPHCVSQISLGRPLHLCIVSPLFLLTVLLVKKIRSFHLEICQNLTKKIRSHLLPNSFVFCISLTFTRSKYWQTFPWY